MDRFSRLLTILRRPEPLPDGRVNHLRLKLSVLRRNQPRQARLCSPQFARRYRRFRLCMRKTKRIRKHPMAPSTSPSLSGRIGCARPCHSALHSYLDVYLRLGTPVVGVLSAARRNTDCCGWSIVFSKVQDRLVLDCRWFCCPDHHHTHSDVECDVAILACCLGICDGRNPDLCGLPTKRLFAASLATRPRRNAFYALLDPEGRIVLDVAS